MRYRIGRRRQRYIRRYGLATVLVVVIAAGVYALAHLHTLPRSVIHNAVGVQKDFQPEETAKVHIDKPLFTVDLPAGWKETAPTVRVNVPNYTFRSTNEDGQLLQVYLDNIPADLALNRVISVSAVGAGMGYDSVSDNCTQYTQAVTGQTSTTSTATAKWQDMEFTCDTGNFQRDVIGTISPDGPNEVTLTGPTAGPHKVFLVYTDNTVNPDFSTLYGILGSFKLK